VRRQIHRRDDVVRENAAARGAQRCRLGPNDSRHALLDLGERRIDAEQGIAEREAIIAQLGHRGCPPS